MKAFLLTESEARLISAIKDLEFGEIYSYEITGRTRGYERVLAGGNAELIEFIRDNGYSEINKIVVHEGEAKQVEIFGERDGIKYKKKVRLS